MAAPAAELHAPSGGFSSGRRAADGRLWLTCRQFAGSFFSGSGTLMMRRHSGQGSRLPANSSGMCSFSPHIGHSKSIVVGAAGGPSVFGSSASAAAARASRSAGGGGGAAGGGAAGGGSGRIAAGAAAGLPGTGTRTTVPQWGHLPRLPASWSLTLRTFLHCEQRNLIDMRRRPLRLSLARLRGFYHRPPVRRYGLLDRNTTVPPHASSRHRRRTCSGVAVPVVPICRTVIDATRQPKAAACSGVAPAARRRRSPRWCCRRRRPDRSARPPRSRRSAPARRRRPPGPPATCPPRRRCRTPAVPPAAPAAPRRPTGLALPSPPGTRPGSASGPPTGTGRCVRDCRRGRKGPAGFWPAPPGARGPGP